MCGYDPCMKIMRGIVMAGIGKKIYDEARKPQNQRRIKDAMQQMRSKQGKRTGHRRTH